MPHNTLTDAERAAGWQLLFDGATTRGWRGFRNEHLPDAWRVEDGTLALVPGAGEGGDIVTVDPYSDFELALAWKVEPGGNSGIFIRVSEDFEHTWQTGPEMQVLDDAGHADGLVPATRAGANYGLHPPEAAVVKPALAWNTVRIIAHGPHVACWLNGVQVVAYELWSSDWEARVAASKFAAYPRYGRNRAGHLALQDHGDRVWYRDLKVRPL